ncbi:MAG: MFS transporter [Chloroflexi bacterium]|nr:MFS transporter [Chloroflexota bacterium]
MERPPTTRLAQTEPNALALSPARREHIYRRNFIAFLSDNILFNLAMGIIGETTVIPDFVRHLTDSEIVIGLSGTLLAIGQTLPQLLVARIIVRQTRKKWWLVGPNIPARSMMLIFTAIMLWAGRERTELILPAFFICFGLAAFGDGLIGVPWAELSGSSLDNRWRARVLGLTTAVTSVLMLGIAPLIGVVLGDGGPGFPDNYTILFGAAGALLVLSILPGVFLHELSAGAPHADAPAAGAFVSGLVRALRDDAPFRAFIITRLLISLFMMAAPFYVGYATVQLGQASEVAVPLLLAMQTVGSLAGALAYTGLGARSNLLAIRLAVGGLALVPASALLAGSVGAPALYVGFMLSGAATSTWFSSYLNWIVGYADPAERPLYVGLSNTLTALISFIAPLIGGTIAQSLGYRPLFVLSLLMALGALFVTLRFLRDKPRVARVIAAAH